MGPQSPPAAERARGSGSRQLYVVWVAQQPHPLPPTPQPRSLERRKDYSLLCLWVCEGLDGFSKVDKVKRRFSATSWLSLVTSNLLLLSSTGSGLGVCLVFCLFIVLHCTTLHTVECPFHSPAPSPLHLPQAQRIPFSVSLFFLFDNDDFCFPGAPLTMGCLNLWAERPKDPSSECDRAFD